MTQTKQAAVTCLITGLFMVILEEHTDSELIRRNVKHKDQYGRLCHMAMHMCSMNTCETEWMSEMEVNLE